MRQLGQKSLFSLLSSFSSSSVSNNPRKCGDLSLSDFLDKSTTTKEMEKKNAKEKEKAKDRGKLSVDSFSKSMMLNEESKLGTLKAPSFSASTPSRSSERVCESLRVRRVSNKDKLVDELKKKRRKRSFGNGYSDKSSGLLVLGDEPVLNRPKLLRSDSGRSIFNHYSDGNGWWEQGMVGLEATTCVEWEGIGSMSLGNPFMSPL